MVSHVVYPIRLSASRYSSSGHVPTWQKALLLAINGGRCENTGTVMVKGIPVLTGETLKFEEVMSNYKKVLTEIARVYNEAMNIIHFMHDKYYYEKGSDGIYRYESTHQPGLWCSRSFHCHRLTVCHQECKGYSPSQRHRLDGRFSISTVHSHVSVIRRPCGPPWVDLVYYFSEELKKLPVYKNARPTFHC